MLLEMANKARRGVYSMPGKVATLAHGAAVEGGAACLGALDPLVPGNSSAASLACGGGLWGVIRRNIRGAQAASIRGLPVKPADRTLVQYILN